MRRKLVNIVLIFVNGVAWRLPFSCKPLCTRLKLLPLQIKTNMRQRVFACNGNYFTIKNIFAYEFKHHCAGQAGA